MRDWQFGFVFLLTQGSWLFGECVMRDGGSYRGCNVSPTQVFFCGAGKLGQKLSPCHSMPGKRGYCCKAGTHTGCKTDSKSAGKWYYLKRASKFSYCKSIFVRPASSTQCVISLYTNSCPFLRYGKAAENKIVTSSTGTRYRQKIFYASGAASSPNLESLDYDPNGSGFSDDESDLWISDAAKTAFSLPYEETACPQAGNDFCGKKYTTEEFVDFTGPTRVPTTGPTGAAARLTDPAGSFKMDPVSDPDAVVSVLLAGGAVSFNDKSCDTGTDTERMTCCQERNQFWRNFCSLHTVSIKRKAPSSGLCDGASPPNTCTYSAFGNSLREPASTGVASNHEDPDP